MPVDNIYAKLTAAVASNTGGAQDWITAWDSYVVPAAGSIRGAYFDVAGSITSNSAAHQADVFRQPSGVAAASNTGASILTAPVSLLGVNTSVAGSIAAGNQRVAAGDILQLKTNEKLVATGRLTGLTATVLILPD